ncbi:MAG: FliM/FliN family flagellar motor switch protein [Porticoccaceae bacterium]
MAGKEVLSDSELEALMETVAEGEAESGVGAQGAYRLFDFSAQRQSPLEDYPALHQVHEKLVSQLAVELKSLFRGALEVEGVEPEVVKLGDAQAAFPELVALNLIQSAPMMGNSLIFVAGDTLSSLVNLYFGGPTGGTAFKSARASLTPTERRVNDLVVERFLVSLAMAWRETVKLTPESVKFETNPDFLHLGAGSSQQVVFHYVLRSHDWEGSLKWLVPIKAFEPIKVQLGQVKAEAADARQEQPKWESHLRKELLTVDVEVSGQIECHAMNLAQLLSLRQGSIIPLESPTEVMLLVEGEPFCNGEYGAMSGKKSVKIKGLARGGE